MRQIYRGNNVINIDKLDNSQYDLVAIYIGPKDKVVLIDATKVKTKRSLQIKAFE